MKKTFVVLLALIILSAQGGITAPDDDPEFKLKNWITYSELVYAIQQCPAWEADSPSTPKQWLPLLQTAARLQELDAREVESILIAYMITEQEKTPGESNRRSWSKPMLLLRLMFEIPTSGRDAFPILHLAPCGGMPSQPPGDKELSSLVSLPIVWEQDNPRIAVAPIYEVGADFAQPYQPHIEFQWMLTKYKPRDLSKWLPSNAARPQPKDGDGAKDPDEDKESP